MSHERREDLDPKLTPEELVVGTVAKLYGLNNVGKPQAMTSGIESAVWLITTDGGKWYVKAYGLHQGSTEDVQEEIELYENLRAKGINVPEVKPSINGKAVEILQTPQTEYPLILMKAEDLTEERPSTISREKMGEVGRAIARLHQAGKDYPKATDYYTGGLADHKVPKSTLEILRASKNIEIFSEEEQAELASLIRKMEEYIEEHPLPADLTKSVLHGDLGLGHTQFLPDGEVYFFDFGDRWFGPVAQDLAVMTENLYRPEDITFERFEHLRSWLMDGYLAEKNLTPKDLQFIKPLIFRRALSSTEYLSNISKNTGREVDSRGIRRRLKLASYLLER